MTLRPALALALCAALVGGGSSALAAPKVKPVCNLLTDPAGDANGTFATDGGVPGAPSEDAVDIVSGDVATKGKNLTTVLRVKKLSASSTSSPTGLHWKFFFNIGDTQVFTQAVAAAGSDPVFSVGTIDDATGTSKTLGEATGVVDVAKNEVRITAPFALFPERPKLGSKITDLAPNAGRFIDGTAFTFSDSTDTATSEKSYTVGAASCVPVGK